MLAIARGAKLHENLKVIGRHPQSTPGITRQVIVFPGAPDEA
ncbi:hypothetical protein [Streptomyces sp. NPDC054865]